MTDLLPVLLRNFKVQAGKLTPGHGEAVFKAAAMAFSEFRAEAGTKKMDEIWAKVRAKEPAYEAFALYAAARTHWFHQSPEYRTWKKSYMAEYTARPEVQERRAAARRKYKAAQQLRKAQVAQ